MPCKYHSGSHVEGTCKECGNEFCSECATIFIEGKDKFYSCLDCAAKFANKRLIQSHVAAAIGFILGLFMVKELGFLVIITAPMYAYMFWGTFFGWFYGGRLWQWLSESDEKHGWTEKYWWLGFILLPMRIIFASLVGIFGGGIAQFLLYRKMVKKQQETSIVLAV